ncbi:MAG: hypothetical protein JRI25_27785, partial [Deltaproteobacteria bacterium]|nr:hypothetical protein [Deltaproteobacteria bacterium]
APAAPEPAPAAPEPAPIEIATPSPPEADVPAPAPSGPAVFVDGVRFEAAHAERALVFVNSAPEEEIRDAGVYGRGVTVILSSRPFETLQAFGDTPYVGEKTVRAVALATQ